MNGCTHQHDWILAGQSMHGEGVYGVSQQLQRGSLCIGTYEML